jgi:hypothetical protein
MTQAWRPDFSKPDDPNWNTGPARCHSLYPAINTPELATITQSERRCQQADGHTGNHAAERTTAPPLIWAQHEHANRSAEWPVTEGTTPPHAVIRLDNGDVEKLPRLAALVAMYDAAKSAADAAAEALKTITDGIKAETSAAVPGGTDFTIVSGTLSHPLTLQYVVSNRVDTKALRAMLTAEQYASLTKPSGSWTLKRKK